MVKIIVHVCDQQLNYVPIFLDALEKLQLCIH